MRRLRWSLAVGGLLTFGVMGFFDALPNGIQALLGLIAILGSALTGGNVHAGSGAFLVASLLGAFTAAAFLFVSALGERKGTREWPLRARRAASLLACLGLFTAAFRVAALTAQDDPWSSPLGPFAFYYALAGVIAGILWPSPRIVLPSLLLSAALGAAFTPPLISLGSPPLSGAGSARVVGLLRLGGLSWITGLLAGAGAWLLLRVVAVRPGVAGTDHGEPEASIGPRRKREVRWRWREIAVGVCVLAVLMIVAFELRVLWWPESVPPWHGGREFTDPSLASLLAPDRPVRSSTFYEIEDEGAFYVADLRDAAPRGYEEHYLELLRTRGVFIRRSGRSAPAPRPDAVEFIALAKGADSDRAWSIRYRRFWDLRSERPELSFWWPLERGQSHPEPAQPTGNAIPKPVQRQGNAIGVRLGRVRDSSWEEAWLLPERDEIEGPELPLPRLPGAIVRDFGPETEDRDIVNPPPPFDVERVYVAPGAPPEEILGHYERALRDFGVTALPRSGVSHTTGWLGNEPVKGIVRVVVSTGAPGLAWGLPLDRPGEWGAAALVFPRLQALAEIHVSLRFQRLEDAVTFWPDAARRRRGLLLAADGELSGGAAPAPIAPKVAILRRGFFADTERLLRDTLHESTSLVTLSRVSAGLLGEHRVLVIPTGALSGLSAQADFVTRVGQFVRAGGVVLAFAQAQGHDYDALPVPPGERLRAIGYDADQSVYLRGVRIDQAHPILASLAEGVATINVDGAFEEVPSGAHVLLRKSRSDLAALIVYPVGHGWVVASSISDDCLSCQRPGPGRPDVVGDMLAWAREPADLRWHAPGSSVLLAVPVSNRGASASASVALRLLSPSRDRVLAEATLPNETPPRRDSQVQWALRVPDDAPRGVHHVSYTLLDSVGRVVQAAVESPVARVVVGEPTRPPEPESDLKVSILLPGGMRVEEGAPLRVEYRLENRLGRERRLRLYANTTRSAPTLLVERVLAARGQIRGSLEVRPQPGERGFWLQVFEVNGKPKGSPRVAVPGEDAVFQIVEGAGFRLGSDR